MLCKLGTPLCGVKPFQLRGESTAVFFIDPSEPPSLPWEKQGPAEPGTARDRVMRGTGWGNGRKKGAAPLEGGEL